MIGPVFVSPYTTSHDSSWIVLVSLVFYCRCSHCAVAQMKATSCVHPVFRILETRLSHSRLSPSRAHRHNDFARMESSHRTHLVKTGLSDMVVPVERRSAVWMRWHVFAGIDCGDASVPTSTQLGVRSIGVAMPVVFKRLEEALTEHS